MRESRVFAERTPLSQKDRTIKNIDKAIENEKGFCEDIDKIKDVIGSNVGKLIEEMRKKEEQ